MKTLEDLRSEMTGRGLAGHFAALAPFAKNAVRIILNECEDDSIPIGCSKFGGCPDLPPDALWFRTEDTGVPMSFLAQVNLAEAAAYDTENKLPKQGMLYFFYDCSLDGMVWGFEPEDRAHWRVLFYNGDLSLLARRNAPNDLEINGNGTLFGQARMGFESCVELPNPESDLCDSITLPDEEDTDTYWDWLDDSFPDQTNKLLGHADPVQGGMELECEIVTNGISCGSPDGYALARQKGLDRNAERWNLLMQIESNEELGMMWGDLGRLYFWITNEDLASQSFENAWLILQCG